MAKLPTDHITRYAEPCCPMERNTSLEGATAKYESWYLVKFQRD
jgi:hypothetical protein